jgi:hypothetical protein
VGAPQSREMFRERTPGEMEQCERAERYRGVYTRVDLEGREGR